MPALPSVPLGPLGTSLRRFAPLRDEAHGAEAGEHQRIGLRLGHGRRHARCADAAGRTGGALVHIGREVRVRIAARGKQTEVGDRPALRVVTKFKSARRST